jgi:hypothetical protein
VFPVILSGLTASITTITAGQAVTLSCIATNDAEYLWDFGDSTHGNAASMTHVYSAAGDFLAVVTITSGDGAQTTGTILIKVLAVNAANADPDSDGIPNYADTDNDGDGYSDNIEIAAGSDPFSYNARPNGAAAITALPAELKVTRFAIALNFKSPHADSMTLAGVLPVPAGFLMAQQKVIVEIAGVVRIFTLDAHGRSRDSLPDKFRISAKFARGKIAGQNAKFSVSLFKGDFANTLTDEGLANETIKNKKIQVGVSVIFKGGLYETLQSQTYTARAERYGRTK